MAKIQSNAQVETEVVTISISCELGRHLACRGSVVSLTAPIGQVCECPVCAHEDEQEPDQIEDEEVALDLTGDLLLEMALEDIHFAEGWS